MAILIISSFKWSALSLVYPLVPPTLYPETFLPHPSSITRRVLPTACLKWTYSYLMSWQTDETSVALWPKHLNSGASYSLAEVWNQSVILCGIIPSPNLVLKIFLWGETFHIRDACKIGNWNGHQRDSLEPQANLLRNSSCSYSKDLQFPRGWFQDFKGSLEILNC